MQVLICCSLGGHFSRITLCEDGDVLVLKLLNKGVTTLVFYDPKEKKKAIMPEELHSRLAPFFKKETHE